MLELQPRFLWLGIVQCMILASAAETGGGVAFSEDVMDWYTRYPAYPPYCSTEEQMEARIIPLLRVGAYGTSVLRHVTAITRHGARVPLHNRTCWKSETPPDPWECSQATFLTPDLTSNVLFSAVFDALQYPQYNLSNFLPGNCQLGQITEQGKVQMLTLGMSLRMAYVDDETGHHNSRMKLHFDDRQLEEYVYFRSDDMQRTIESGQLVLNGMFGPDLAEAWKITMHTADLSQDIIAHNEETCPRLAEIKERYYQTREFRLFNESDGANELREFERQLGGDGIDMDCLMTTICSDRTLPEGLDDYEGEPTHNHQSNQSSSEVKSMFSRWAQFLTRQKQLLAEADFAAYSKLAVGPLWSEVLDNVQTVLEDETEGHQSTKFALFSAHDSTLVALLASLGLPNREWPPYASALVLEMHDINLDGRKDSRIFQTDFGFRLIYNGRVVTEHVKGCPKGEEMCDYSVLFGKRFDRTPDACQRVHVVPKEYTPAATQATEMLKSSSHAIGLVILVVSVSMLLGAALTYMYFLHLLPSVLKRRAMENSIYDDEEEEIIVSSDNRRGGFSNVRQLEPHEQFTIDDEDEDEPIGVMS